MTSVPLFNKCFKEFQESYLANWREICRTSRFFQAYGTEVNYTIKLDLRIISCYWSSYASLLNNGNLLVVGCVIQSVPVFRYFVHFDSFS